MQCEWRWLHSHSLLSTRPNRMAQWWDIRVFGWLVASLAGQQGGSNLFVADVETSRCLCLHHQLVCVSLAMMIYFRSAYLCKSGAKTLVLWCEQQRTSGHIGLSPYCNLFLSPSLLLCRLVDLSLPPSLASPFYPLSLQTIPISDSALTVQ